MGAYRLLVLDGHGSHATADFDHFCKENKIIPLYMPPHSSHLLQPLDVACFGPLKKRYGSEIQNCMAANIQHIDKRMFLDIYKIACLKALTAANVISGFATTGLIPYKPERVLDNLHFQLHTPTPPSESSGSDESSWTAETPKTAKDLRKQSMMIEQMWKERTKSPPSPEQSAFNQVVKACNIAMQSTLLLQQKNNELRARHNQYKRHRDTGRTYIQNGGILTAEEAQRCIQESQRYISIPEEEDRPRKRAALKCTSCGVQGHTRVSCNSK